MLEGCLKGPLLWPTLTQSFPFPHTRICHVRQRPRPKLQGFQFCDRQSRGRVGQWSDAAFPAASAEEQTRGDDQVPFQLYFQLLAFDSLRLDWFFVKYWRCGNHRVIACCGEPPDLMVCSGVIGTGLFLSSANSLRNGGPVGLLLGYMIVGTICYSVMVGRVVSSSHSCPLRTFAPRYPLGKWSLIFQSLAGISNWQNASLILPSPSCVIP